MCSKTISVIIPVYNTEQFLDKCILSLLNQTYKDLEIIAVDNGSTDNSGQILDKFSTQDKRIKVFHIDNISVGEARNFAIGKATGDFITFVDSDDWIEPEAYEYIINLFELENCDIVSFGHFVEKEDGTIQKKGAEKSVLLTNKKTMTKRLLTYDGLTIGSWDKVSKRELFTSIRYPDSPLISEDFIPMFQLVQNADSIYVTDQCFYHYIKHPNSLTAKTYNQNTYGSVVYAEMIERMTLEQYPDLTMETEFFTVQAMIDVDRKMLAAGYKGEDREKIKQKLKEHKKMISSNQYLNKKQKAYVSLVIHKKEDIPDKIFRTIKNKRKKK